MITGTLERRDAELFDHSRWDRPWKYGQYGEEKNCQPQPSPMSGLGSGRLTSTPVRGNSLDCWLYSRAKRKLPSHIVQKFDLWRELVEAEGLEVARAVRGFRDHALQGEWQGYRAIRLSKSYRAIYIVQKIPLVVHVEEVNNHEY